MMIGGNVVRGDGIGRLRLGCATANIKIDDNVTAVAGVWYCEAVMGNVNYKAIANLGICPFYKKNKMLEVHLLWYQGDDFYGEYIKVTLLKHVRDERNFETEDDLKNAIACDVCEAKKWFI